MGTGVDMVDKGERPSEGAVTAAPSTQSLCIPKLKAVSVCPYQGQVSGVVGVC